MKCNKVIAHGAILNVKPAKDRTHHSFSQQIQNGRQEDVVGTECRATAGPKVLGGRGGKTNHLSDRNGSMATVDVGRTEYVGRGACRGRRASCWRGGRLMGINGRQEAEEKRNQAQSGNGKPKNDNMYENSVGNYMSRPMAARVRPAVVGTDLPKCRGDQPVSQVHQRRKGRGLLKYFNFSPCCGGNTNGHSDDLAKLRNSQAESFLSGELVIGAFQKDFKKEKECSAEKSLKRQSYSDDSLDDDFDWDWSLLPQRPSHVPPTGPTHSSALSPSPSDPKDSSKLPSSFTTSPSLSLQKADHRRSVSGSSVPDEEFWGDGVSSAASRRQVLPRQCKGDMEGSVGGSMENLIPVTISKMESPDMMWVQMVSDPDKILEGMSAQMYGAMPPKLKEVGLGKLCCFMLHTPMQKEKRFMIRRALIKENEHKYVMEPQVGVILIDVGTELQCVVKDLHELPEDVALETHPPLASPLALRGVASSYYGGSHWYFQDLDTIRRTLRDRTVYMEKQRHQGEVSKYGYNLATMFMDPHREKNVADKLIDDCYFVVRSYPKKKPDSTHRFSSLQSSTGRIDTTMSADKCIASTGLVGHRCLQLSEAPPEGASSGAGRKRRSMMGLITKAMAQLDESKNSS